MKAKKGIKYPPAKSTALKLQDTALATGIDAAPMVRTQIYLNPREYDFVQREASRRDEPMAAVIRSFIDEKMEIPEDAWTNNPMLEPTVHYPDWQGHEDGGINHDHYVSGGPKKWIKRDGKWVEAPPLPDDYFDNPASHKAYDRVIESLDETK